MPWLQSLFEAAVNFLLSQLPKRVRGPLPVVIAVFIIAAIAWSRVPHSPIVGWASKPLAIPRGAMLMGVLMVAAMLVWVWRWQRKQSRRWGEANVKLASALPNNNAAQPHALPPPMQSKWVPCPERKVAYRVEFPSGRQTTSTDAIYVRGPYCIVHETLMKEENRFLREERPMRKVKRWRCAGCGQEIARADHERLQVLAKSAIITSLRSNPHESATASV